MIVWKTRPHLPAYVAYGAAADTLPRGLSNEKDIHEHLDTKNEPASVAEGYVESLLKETKPSNALKGFVDCEHHPQNWKKNNNVNPRRHKPKKVTQRHKWWGTIGPLPCNFDTTDPIDLVFGTYSEKLKKFGQLLAMVSSS